MSTFSMSPYDNVNSGMTRTGAAKFPNPWFDIASEYIPTEINQIFDWCSFLYMSMGTWRSVSRKVCRYFLTELDITGESEEERQGMKELLNDKLHIMNEFAQIGEEFMCFHGDTLVPTRMGVYPIRELEGRVVEVLSRDGKYRKAKFKAFGTQELLEVEFSDGRTVLATPEHQWYVRKSNGGEIKVPTTLLRGRVIKRTVADRPVKNEEFREGVRHGFIFGDGTTYNKNKRTSNSASVSFDVKDGAVRSYFEECGDTFKIQQNGRIVRISGFSERYKLLPNNEASAEYWYGFVCGLLAANKSVDEYGCTYLCQASEATLKAVVAQFPRIGMVAGPIRTYPNRYEFICENSRTDIFDGSISVVTLLKRFMRTEDFIVEEHRRKFEMSGKAKSYGEYIGVRDVRKTGLVDKVYCCVEPETHTFVIGNGVLTGNCYGNVFISVYFPFERFLICPKCHTEYPAHRIAYSFRAADTAFIGKCLKCSYEGAFKAEDRRSPDKDRIRLIRWNPKEIRLRAHPVSGRVEYYWEMPARFADQLIKGDEFAVSDTPMSVLRCVSSSAGKDNSMQRLFKFKPDSIYHMREATLSGIPIIGWGIPPIMPNFKLAYYIQVLRRYDEAIAMDYIIPFRILYPTVGAQPQQDAVLSSNLSEFRGHMLRMVHERRRDPTNVQVAPFQIGYQMVGGEARAIAPKESIKFAVEELLNAAGYPAELYMGSLSMQTAPVALRLFERTQNALVEGYNDLSGWITRRIARQYMMGEMGAKLRSVTLADDIERKALQLQAAAGMDISKSTAYSPLKINYLEEQKKIIDEQTELQKMQQEAAAQAQAAQAQAEAVAAGQEGGGTGGAAATGGAGMSGPGGQPGSPMELMQQADQIANDMLFSMPETLRRSQLIKLKQTNPTLHAMVTQLMDDKRQSMATQGQAGMMQQGQQAVQAGEPPPV